MENNKKENGFDADQGHGEHLECIANCCEGPWDFVKYYIAKYSNEVDVLGVTQNPVLCDIEGCPDKMNFKIFGESNSSLRVCSVSAMHGDTNSIVSMYPEFDGSSAKVRISEICEWARGIGAIIKGDMFVADEERLINFVDTRYVLNKEKYKIGETYEFLLSAFAYDVELVPENELEFRFEGEDAIKHYRVMNEPVKHEADGSVKPVVFYMHRAVGFVQDSKAYPQDAEIFSPVFKRVRLIKRYDCEFYNIEIAIAAGGDNDYIKIPLISKKSNFERRPKTDEPIKGDVWIQGRLAQ